MKKVNVFLAAAIICVCFAGVSPFAEVMAQSTDMNRPTSLSQNQPNPFTEITHISFFLMEDYFVRLYTVDQLTGNMQMLVEGEMSKGEHGVIFKTQKKNKTNEYKCFMEVFSTDGRIPAGKLSTDMKQIAETERSVKK